MTSKQKAKIAELRTKGTSYANIADLLDISVNTVKSYCRRNSLNAAAENTDDTVCRACGVPLMQVKGQKKKSFCSDKCRLDWWHSHTEQLVRKAVYEYNCPSCGKPFTAYGNAKRKYCSHACYISSRFAGASCAGGTANE